MTDLLNCGSELQAKLNDLVLGGCEVADSCQGRPSDGWWSERRSDGGGRREEKRKDMGRQQGESRKKKRQKNGFTFVGVFPQYSSPRLHAPDCTLTVFQNSEWAINHTQGQHSDVRLLLGANAADAHNSIVSLQPNHSTSGVHRV